MSKRQQYLLRSFVGAAVAALTLVTPVFALSNSDTALNWAGYVAKNGTYTSVSGSWIVPTVQSNDAVNLADTTWVGIGGVKSEDLIQAGTEALPNSAGGVSYRAWMELLPGDSQLVPLAVSPGDAVSVSIIEQSAGVWDVSFDDATTGKTYEQIVRYASSLSSAEWVEEMPVEVGGIVGLDDFGTVDFTSGYAIENGRAVTIASSGATPLVMQNSVGQAVASPSALMQNGTSFSVTRTDAPSSPLALSPMGVSLAAAAYTPYRYIQTPYGFGGGYARFRHRMGGFTITIEL